MTNLEKGLLAITFGYVLADMFGLSKSECINIALLSASGPLLYFSFDVFDLLKKKINGLNK